MGGPKDEIAPTLLSITPANESTNVKPTAIILDFDEYVKAETPTKSILITPRIKKEEMEVTTNKNRVTIKLNQELEDSTTYVFNFQKSIKDVTENNVPENLRLVFSTGPSIDSLTVSGNVSYRIPQDIKNIKDVLVGLYPLDDTTNVFTGPPYYVTQTDSTGAFNLQNLKAGTYLGYAWHDANGSNKAEFKTEPYSFILDTIKIESNSDGLNFILDKSDLSDFKIQRSATFGQNFDITATKTPVDIAVVHEDLGKDLFFKTNEKAIRFYHRQIQNDSIQVTLNIIDSVGFKIDTAIYLKFQPSDRKKDVPVPSFPETKNFTKNLQSRIVFNKPIYQVNFDSLLIKYDSASSIRITREMLAFNDSLQRSILLLNVPVPDTIKTDNYTLYIGDSTFMDVENVWNNKNYQNSYKRLNTETLAEEIKVTVETTESPLIVQILNKKGDLIAENYLENQKSTVFKNIEAGTYIIRAIVDFNKNKRWDTSNFLEQRYAEPIYYLSNPENPEAYDTVIRGGWALDVTIHTRKGSGIFPTNSEKEEK